MSEDIWYKPKYVFDFGERFDECVSEIDSVTNLELVGDAIFQLEIFNEKFITKNDKYNISKIFTKYTNNENSVTNAMISLINNKIINIYNFNIIFFIHDSFSVIWPEHSERAFRDLSLENVNFAQSVLTYEEFVIKTLLE